MKRIVDIQPLIDKVVSCIRTDMPNPKISLGECLYHLQALPVISDDRSSEKPVGEWLVRKSTTSSLFRECPYCVKSCTPCQGCGTQNFALGMESVSKKCLQRSLKMANFIKESALDNIRNLAKQYAAIGDDRCAQLLLGLAESTRKVSMVSSTEILKQAATCDLVKELESRTDVVKTTYVDPYDIEHFSVEGPAVILEVID